MHDVINRTGAFVPERRRHHRDDRTTTGGRRFLDLSRHCARAIIFVQSVHDDLCGSVAPEDVGAAWTPPRSSPPWSSSTSTVCCYLHCCCYSYYYYTVHVGDLVIIFFDLLLPPPATAIGVVTALAQQQQQQQQHPASLSLRPRLPRRRRRPFKTGPFVSSGCGCGGGGLCIRRKTTAIATTVPLTATTATTLALMIPRAGGATTVITSLTPATFLTSPSALYDALLVVLVTTAAVYKFSDHRITMVGRRGRQRRIYKHHSNDDNDDYNNADLRSLRRRYLPAFWFLRCSYWMAGPYVVQAYRTKVPNAAAAANANAAANAATAVVVSYIFLTGFAATALLGPLLGQMTDRRGGKAGTLAFCLLYAMGFAGLRVPTRVASRTTTLAVLMVGRAMIGCSLGLMMTAPEAWLNGEARRLGLSKRDVGTTLGMAYTGDALVAVLAGKLGTWATSAGLWNRHINEANNGINLMAPFDVAVVILAVGATVISLFWKENTAADAMELNGGGSATNEQSKESSKSTSSSSSMRDALDIVMQDPKLLLLGAVQSIFEATMYVFILQWPSAIGRAVQGFFGNDTFAPFGTVYSCFMTCSLLGSLLFGKSNSDSNSDTKNNGTKATPRRLVETTLSGVLAVATVSFALSSWLTTNTQSIPPGLFLAGITTALCIYEACVGMYFPAIGTIRSRMVPDDKKSVIASIFGVPLNVLVAALYLSADTLGMGGSLGVSAGLLAVATGCMVKLQSIVRHEEEEEAIVAMG